MNNAACQHVIKCTVCSLKVLPALQLMCIQQKHQNRRHRRYVMCIKQKHQDRRHRRYVMCIQQKHQDRRHRRYVMCTAGQVRKPERTLLTNASSSWSLLPCKVLWLGSLQCISVTTAIMVWGKEIVRANSSDLPRQVSTLCRADSSGTCRQD